MKNNSPFRDLAPVFMVCVLLPTTAGMWWRYYFESSAPQPPTLSGTFQTEHLESDGLDRSFSFYAPSQLASSAPLLVALHGANSSGENLRVFTGYEFDVLADRYGFMVAYPDSFSGSWNDCRVPANNPARRQGIDDVDFVKTVIARLRARFAVRGPVYVLGYSTGGLMVYRLAVEAPETFTAAAAISANLPAEDESDCVASGTPVSIAILNGTADQINPFEGGSVHSLWTTSLGDVQSAEQSARYFARLAGISSEPHIDRFPDRDGRSSWSERRTWAGGTANIELLAIHGGGHTISQARVRQPRILGPTSAQVDAPEEAWRFFTQPDEKIAVMVNPGLR